MKPNCLLSSTLSGDQVPSMLDSTFSNAPFIPGEIWLLKGTRLDYKCIKATNYLVTAVTTVGYHAHTVLFSLLGLKTLFLFGRSRSPIIGKHRRFCRLNFPIRRKWWKGPWIPSETFHRSQFGKGLGVLIQVCLGQPSIGRCYWQSKLKKFLIAFGHCDQGFTLC